MKDQNKMNTTPLIIGVALVTLLPACLHANTSTAKRNNTVVANFTHNGPKADTDSDGLPDGWEAAHGLDPRIANGPSLDTDGDGLIDTLEYQYGKNPELADASIAIFYKARVLPTPIGYDDAYAESINDAGDAVGGVWSWSSFNDYGVRWTSSDIDVLPTPSWLYKINNHGAAVGYRQHLQYGNTGLMWDASGGIMNLYSAYPHHNFYEPRPLYYALDINGLGGIVGTSNWSQAAYVSSTTGYELAQHSSIFDATRANAINDKNQIVGNIIVHTIGQSKAAIWESSKSTPVLIENMSAMDINNSGWIIGNSVGKVAVRDPLGLIHILDSLTHATISAPFTINNFNEIVGSTKVEGMEKNVIWRPNRDGGWSAFDIANYVLDKYIVGDGFGVKSINNRGQICGSFFDENENIYKAIILDPVFVTGLLVDANRDGQIKLPSEDDSDATTSEKHYRFWSNDDIDRLHDFLDTAAESMNDITEYEEDDIGAQEASAKGWQADWKDNVANSRRDLEDFSRIVISTQGLDDQLRLGEIYIGLKWSDTNSTTPAIKLYKQYDSDGGLSYLTSDLQAGLQMPEKAIVDARYASDDPATSTHTLIEGDQVFVLPKTVWGGLPLSLQRRSFLFEGCKAGKGQLKLVILKPENGSYTEIGEGPGVWLELKTISDIYEHWSVGNNNGGQPDVVAARTAAESGSGNPFRYDANGPSPEERQYIMFVHGWNMQKWEKERFAETAYKRLWWQGYKGRFGLFTWPCTHTFDAKETLIAKGAQGVANGTHFDRGEWTAWRSGAPLRQLMQTLSGTYNGELHVFSHSMGAIAVSEALRLQSQSGGGQVAKVYVPSQAAMSAHLYDGLLSSATDSPHTLQWEYNHPSLPNGTQNYGPHTPNTIYPGWFTFMLDGGVVGSKSVGSIVNFYHTNDWALAAPVWQFNQITKPDYRDTFNDQPYLYEYDSLVAKFGRINWLNVRTFLEPGTRADPADRYEITAFAAESRVKAFGATPNVGQGITFSINLADVWGADPRGGDHKAHLWHSGQFRSIMPYQKNYWKALLGNPGFRIIEGTLP